MNKILKTGILTLLILTIGCEGESYLKNYKSASLFGGVNHPWEGDWVAIWTGSMFRALQLDAPVFTIQNDGGFQFAFGAYRDTYQCLAEINEDTFLYQRIKVRDIGNLKKQEYAKFKIFHLSNDPEMLCDQLWRSEYAPTPTEARLKEVTTPFASRESLAMFWTEAKLEGMHVIYAGFKKLFLKIKQLADFARSGGRPGRDQVDGFMDDDDFSEVYIDEYLEELDERYESTRL